MSGFAATATARSLRHHVLRYRTPLAIPLATVVAVAVAANSVMALAHEVQETQSPNPRQQAPLKDCVKSHVTICFV